MNQPTRHRAMLWAMRHKWCSLLAYWFIQACVLYGLAAAWVVQGQSVDSNDPLGSLSPESLVEEMMDMEFVIWTGIVILLMTLLQAVFVAPLASPAPRSTRGLPVLASLGVAGLAMSLLATGLAFAIAHVIELYIAHDTLPEWIFTFPVLGGVILAQWTVATALLWSFTRAGSREHVLGRVASWLFTGTIVEAAAIIPLDVLVRKRESCYCAAGTFWALAVCGSIGIITMGPAILIPLIARRRRRWYQNRCDACGYSMQGISSAIDRCPECGLGWKASAS